MFGSFRGSFVVSAHSIRDEGLRSTVESIRKQNLVEWECVLYLDEFCHEWELIVLSRHSPRFRLGTSTVWCPWADIRSDLAIHVIAGVELTENAFASIVNTNMSGVALLYGDSTEVGRPDWSPQRYRHDKYFGDVVAFKRENEPGSVVKRITEPLSIGRRRTFPSVPRAEVLMLAECAQDRVLSTISVVVPTAGRAAPGKNDERAMVLDLVASLGTHDSVSIVIVADSCTPPEVVSELLSTPGVRVIGYDKPFNFSDKCNKGALSEDSDIVFFLNDDMICLEPDWPHYLRTRLAVGRIGALGGLLLTRDGKVQCAGHANSPVPHVFASGLDPNEPSLRSVLGIARETSGLSGACLAMRRDTFLEVGGMCTQLAEGYNDVDLGFKVLSAGKSLIFEPGLRFIHFESATREPEVKSAEYDFVSARWGRFFERDPFLPI